jgi:hypothetical protein
MSWDKAERNAMDNLYRKGGTTSDFVIAKIILFLFKFVFKTLWTAAITLVWVLAITIAAATSAQLGWVVAALAVGTIAAGFWKPGFWRFAPIVGDAQRLITARQAKKYLKDGKKFLLQTGLVRAQHVEDFEVDVALKKEEDKYIFILNEPLDGVSQASLVLRVREFEPILDAKRSYAEPLSGGGVKMTFYLVDPLDEPLVLDEPGQFDPEKMQVECAVNSFGEMQTITFGDSSGMVVGGIPGSGKTAGLTSFLLPMALSEYVDLSIIDGKGGTDWSSYESVASTYISGDEELEPIRDFLKEFHSDMVKRVQTQKELLGESNFWNVSADERLAAGLKFKLLVIDECQGVFEKTGRSKEEKELLEEIFRYLSAIVKRGRSAGFFAVFITQKPTAEALPTAIRDNAGLRIAFRLQTTQAETAVLGVSASDGLDIPRATEIPSDRKGGAVLGTDTGTYESVRFFYIPEKEQELLLNSDERVEARGELAQQ